MEETVKEQQPVVVTGKSKLRYPLRSATKVKEETPPVADLSNSSTSKRGRSGSSVSKSVGVLDLSSKEKSAKPPRRLSIPTKPVANVGAKSVGNVTPIAEARTKRSTSGQSRSETPLSDISRTSSRKKFNMLSSSSYWLSQIKLSESVSKHSISIGFFKLALEAGCEPIQRMRDELKSYLRRHEMGESVKELLESYNITESQEQVQVQVSETCSQVPEEGTRSSDDEVHSSSTTGSRKLRPRALNANSSTQVSTVRESAKKDILQKNTSTPKTRESRSKNTANSRSVADTAGGRKVQKKPQRPSKQEASKENEKGKMKMEGKKSTAASEEGEASPTANAVASEENKENVDGPMEEEISMTEVN